ncbi:MAG: GNAT family N-acetyltransferase [Bacteroidetes bacterium]|nr:GNAT family N-acetyltransferase [Bacteroidota bacterium]
MNGKVEIKNATPGDAPSVAEIGRLTFYETWRPVNTEEDMQLYLESSFNEKQMLAEITDQSANTFLLAVLGDEPIGYVKMRRDRTYDEFKNEKSIEIERIYVKKKFQDQKIGKLLMDHCIELAKSENSVWIWLGVNNENVKAIEFYKKYGFEIFGTKKFILGTAVDEDFLMKLNIENV